MFVCPRITFEVMVEVMDDAKGSANKRTKKDCTGKPGRPVGSKLIPYSSMECEVAFKLLMRELPIVKSNADFIMKLQKVLTRLPLHSP